MRYLILFALALSSACTSEIASSEGVNLSPAVATRAAAVRASDLDLPGYCAGRPGEAANDSIIVDPAQAELRVGEVLWPGIFGIRSSRTGEHIPVHFAVDSPHLIRDPRGFAAISAGTAQLRVRPLCSVVADEGTIPETLVPVTVRP